MDKQRAIDSAGRMTLYFAALEPYQMAEVGCASMPHYPDFEYWIDKGVLPRAS